MKSTADEALADFPDFTREMLVELGGALELRAARKLFQDGAVSALQWEPPVLSGTIDDGDQQYQPTLNLRSLVFTDNRCTCETGRRGLVCRHALALCLQAEDMQRRVVAQPPDPSPRREPESSAPLSSIPVRPDGPSLSLWILLPPNLERAAQQGQIPLKLELETGAWRGPPEQLPENTGYAVSPTLHGALAELESMGGGRLAGLIRLAPPLLAALLAALGEEARLAWVRKPAEPIPYSGGIFPGVTAHLAAPSSTPGASPQPPPRPRAAPPRPIARTTESRPVRITVDGSEHFLSFRFSDNRHPQALPWIDILKEAQFKREPSNERYWLRDRHHTLNFLARHWAALEEDPHVEFSSNFRQRTGHLERVSFNLRTTESAGRRALSMELNAGDAAPGELQRAMLSNQSYLAADRKIYLLPPDLLERATELQRNLTGQKERVLATRFKADISAAALPVAAELLEEYDPAFVLPETWSERGRALRRIDQLEPAPVDPAFAGQLRPYQRLGAAWLWHLYRHDLGGILADEMGLGKTLQALALIQGAVHLASPEGGEDATAVVVCPASLVENWRRESARFTPGLRTFAHHGARRLQEPGQFAAIDLVITSYGTLVRDLALFQAARISVLLADEAQHVKNRRTQASRALRALHARGRFVLTGTPIENSAEDLRNLFAFLMPGYLKPPPAGTKGEDRLWYDQHHVAQAAPYVLRRTKKVVAPELPAKIEQTLFCEFTEAQRTLYESIRLHTERQIFEMEMAGAGENRIKFAALTQLLRLRQVCADPRVLDPEFKANHSAKWRALREILHEAMDDGHRILLFSQFTGVLKLLRKSLQAEDIPLCYLDGATTNRQQVCDRFNGDPSIPVFLISLKAGGVGLNLTGADTVIHYDPWWNPAAEAQATDRAHRIGQDRVVTSIKFIAANSVEEKVLQIQASKARLLEELFEASDAATAKVSLADIKALVASPTTDAA